MAEPVWVDYIPKVTPPKPIDLGPAPPQEAPNPYNPSGLILRGGGGAFGLATFPTYPEPKL